MTAPQQSALQSNPVAAARRRFRRPSVTTELLILEGSGLIRADRGHVTISDRAALEVFAGDCYGKPEREYRRLLGPM